MRRRFLGYLAFIITVCVYALPVSAIDANQVLVVYNAASADGQQIANYYSQVHPGVQLLGLTGVSSAEQITAGEYLYGPDGSAGPILGIREQILAGLTADIQIIVTTKDLPVRIDTGAPYGNDGKYSSLESELTRIDRISTVGQMADQMWDAAHWGVPNVLPANPYYLGPNAFQPDGKPLTGFDRSNPVYEEMRLTARLDGYDVASVTGAIDDAQRAYVIPNKHTFILDDDADAPAALPESGNRIAQLRDNVLIPNGMQVVEDTGVVTDAPWDVMGYVSHGSYAGGEGYVNNWQFEAAAGSVFYTYESYNAFSYQEDGNYGIQGLVSDWIEYGATVAMGHVREPHTSFADLTNVDIVFDMLISGYTMAEAFWAANRQLSYVNVMVGDPLMTWVPWLEGDLNMDGTVNIFDFAVLQNHWLQNGGLYDGDINGDWVVNIFDFAILQNNWLMMAGGSLGDGSGGESPEVMMLAIPGGGDSEVPEPTTLLTALIAMTYISTRRPKN